MRQPISSRQAPRLVLACPLKRSRSRSRTLGDGRWLPACPTTATWASLRSWSCNKPHSTPPTVSPRTATAVRNPHFGLLPHQIGSPPPCAGGAMPRDAAYRNASLGLQPSATPYSLLDPKPSAPPPPTCAHSRLQSPGTPSPNDPEKAAPLGPSLGLTPLAHRHPLPTSCPLLSHENRGARAATLTSRFGCIPATTCRCQFQTSIPSTAVARPFVPVLWLRYDRQIQESALLRRGSGPEDTSFCAFNQ